jgi:hypothetical protein
VWRINEGGTESNDEKIIKQRKERKEKKAAREEKWKQTVKAYGWSECT